MKIANRRIFYFSMAVLAALSLAALSGYRAVAQQTPTGPEVLSGAVVNAPIHFNISQPLANVSTAPAPKGGRLLLPAPRKPKQHLASASPGAVATGNPLTGPRISASVGLSFDGVGQNATLNCPSVSGFAVVPPDTNAAVGDTQVVEWVNLCFAVFDKSSGALILGPIPGNAFWAGFGGGCEFDNSGDPIIQWDKAHHRWLASQNDFGPGFGGPYQTCIAVSETADATGSYFQYSFGQPGFPDYPKWGLTRNAYYQAQNDFGAAATSFVGVNVCAYDAKNMVIGSSKATQVCILDTAKGTGFDDSMLPADDDTVSADSGGSGSTNSEILLGSIDNIATGGSKVYEYVFQVHFGNPITASLAGIDGSMPIHVPAYILAFCPAGSFDTLCVPQPSAGSELLDTLGDRLMYRLARFVDSHGTQHFLVNHSVNDTAAVAARWYEFRAPSGSTSLSLYQSGQTPNDGEYRWMGSVAMDRKGDIALGYSRSSALAGDYPSIYFAGQTAGDKLGTTEAEALIKAGSGSQLSSFDRWGDYTSMALDGNSCTFWYANEYYPADGSFAWNTWLASIKFTHCT